jgi:hypothetical protein
MKKVGLFLLAVVMVGMVGCSGGSDGGSDGGNYDFNGTWSASSTVVESNLSDYPVGTNGADTLVITQSGTAISGVLDGTYSLSGTCDPGSGSFSMTGKAGSATWEVTMQKEDADTLSGTFTITGGSLHAKFSTTMNLVSRNKSVVMTGGIGAGKVFSLIEALNPAP